MVLRRLPAEVAMDAVAQATASTDRLATLASDLARRAIGPSAGATGDGGKGAEYALSVFGKPTRDMNCDCERVADPSLLQTIFTRNDPILLSYLDGGKDNLAWIAELRRASGGGKPRAGKAVARGKLEDADRVIEEVFLRTVSRPPSAEEVRRAKDDIAAAKDPVDGVREVLWAMLNTREFLVNH
jgi:hypothetical protein